MKIQVCMVFLAAMFLVGCCATLPSLRVPDALGVNIHFTGAPARDLDMIQAAGFRLIRMDFHWAGIEKKRGVYDFAPYDQLTDALQKRGIRALYILDYSNKLYGEDRGIRTEEGRQAFARFAAEAAKRYRGRGIIWELWNEPNIGFWEPQPSLDGYMALAKVVLPAIKQADPGALRVAPATSGVAFEFLEGCFKQGLLQMVEGITIHPYRQLPPETVEADILKLRALIARYRPDRPDFPILSGEWGYSCVWNEFSDERQGQYLPRELLTNLSLGLPVSIWYDWHDDGIKPKDPECHFGTVTHDYKPKPSYLAMQRLTQALSGMHFLKRLQSGPEDCLLLFSDERRYAIAAWTTGSAHEAELFAGKKVQLTGDPQYVPVPSDAKDILAEGAWTVVVPSVGIKGGAPLGHRLAPEFEARVRNPFPERVGVNVTAEPAEGLNGKFTGAQRFELGPGEEKRLRWQGQTAKRDAGDLDVKVEADIGGHRSWQKVTYIIMNPISISVAPEGKDRLSVALRNPAGEAFAGTLVVQVGQAKTASYRSRLAPQALTASVEAVTPAGAAAVQTRTIGDAVYISLPVDINPKASIRVLLREGQDTVVNSGGVRFMSLQVNTETARAFNDGDAKVPATFELTEVETKEQDAPAKRVLRLTYDFGKGWKFVRIAPPKALPIEGKPKAIGVWVRGDGSDCGLNMRFVDQNKRTFQATFGRLNFKDWRFLTAELDNPKIGHWGGQGDPNYIAYPININTFILVDGKREPVKGDVQFGGFWLVYQE